MLYFKSCLRCKDGTVELGADNFGSFLSCLNCGYTINSRSIRADGSIDAPVTLEDEVVTIPDLEPVLASDEVGELDLDDFEEEIEDFDFDLEQVAVG
ncbi:MAG: hypothetical protein ACO3L6_06025 [Dehalococcoidia bacterium]|jgi:hypothetical protein